MLPGHPVLAGPGRALVNLAIDAVGARHGGAATVATSVVRAALAHPRVATVELFSPRGPGGASTSRRIRGCGATRSTAPPARSGGSAGTCLGLGRPRPRRRAPIASSASRAGAPRRPDPGGPAGPAVAPLQPRGAGDAADRPAPPAEGHRPRHAPRRQAGGAGWWSRPGHAVGGWPAGSACRPSASRSSGPRSSGPLPPPAPPRTRTSSRCGAPAASARSSTSATPRPTRTWACWPPPCRPIRARLPGADALRHHPGGPPARGGAGGDGARRAARRARSARPTGWPALLVMPSLVETVGCRCSRPPARARPSWRPTGRTPTTCAARRPSTSTRGTPGRWRSRPSGSSPSPRMWDRQSALGLELTARLAATAPYRALIELVSRANLPPGVEDPA